MNRILIITYYWPPSGGAGVQRWLKFSKYLPEYGWEPVILTVDPDYATYPAVDSSLEKEIPDNLEIHKTLATDWYKIFVRDKSKVPSAGFAKTNEDNIKGRVSRFIRGNFFIPDPRRGWNRFAYKKAIELIENEKIRHVLTTSPPHSTQLIGLKLKKRFPGIKWIADFRDPWTDIYYYKMFNHTLPARLLNNHYEKTVIENADLVLTVSESLTKLMSSKAGIPTDKYRILTNGYDEADFKGLTSERKDNNFIITYVGTISGNYPIESFLKVISELKTITGKEILFRVVGQISKQQEKLIIKYLEDKNRSFIAYSDHNSSVKYMLNSDILLLVIPDHPKNELIVTGKLFEYLRTGNPILCLGPTRGDAAKILNWELGKVFGYDDSNGMSDFIRNLPEYPELKTGIEQWERNNITRQLADYLIK